MSEVVAMEEVVAVGEPVAEAAVDEDAMMQDMLAVVLVAEAGLPAEMTRMMPRDAMEELL